MGLNNRPRVPTAPRDGDMYRARGYLYVLPIAFRERLTTTASSEEPVESPTSIAFASASSLRTFSGILALSMSLCLSLS